MLLLIESLLRTEVLIMACSKITLRKDMSLNRRLWTYFLGPETEHESLKALTRTEYFKQYVEETLINGLLAMAHSDKIELKCDAFKILLPLIMDKWEIGNVLTLSYSPRFKDRVQ